MKKKKYWPVTKKVHPEPPQDDLDWIIWAAWADRITFEEIKEKTGLSEPQVIALMRKHQKPSSFARWRKRVSCRKTKHRKRFSRQQKSARRAQISPQAHFPSEDDF